MMNSGSDRKKGIALFASGAGTNAENCIRYFRGHPSIRVELIASNRKSAGVLEKARAHGIRTCLLDESVWNDAPAFAETLNSEGIDMVVLAGYLALLPAAFIEHFNGMIINIHPALLPKYGGRGMFGRNVHRSVLLNRESETGITIHEVNEEYDKGKIVFQKRVEITAEDTEETIEKKVRELEYYFLPRVIEKLLLKDSDLFFSIE